MTMEQAIDYRLRITAALHQFQTMPLSLMEYGELSTVIQMCERQRTGDGQDWSMLDIFAEQLEGLLKVIEWRRANPDWWKGKR